MNNKIFKNSKKLVGMLLLLLITTSCATSISQKPLTPKQKLLVARNTIIEVTIQIEKSHLDGLLNNDQYTTARNLIEQASILYNDALIVYKISNGTSTDYDKLTMMNSIIFEIQKYLK